MNFSVNFGFKNEQQGVVRFNGIWGQNALRFNEQMLTKNNLAGFGRLAQYFMPFTNIGALFTALSDDSVFSRADADGNGFLSRTELDNIAKVGGDTQRTLTMEKIQAFKASAPIANPAPSSLEQLLAGFGLFSTDTTTTTTSSPSSSNSTNTNNTNTSTNTTNQDTTTASAAPTYTPPVRPSSRLTRDQRLEQMENTLSQMSYDELRNMTLDLEKYLNDKGEPTLAVGQYAYFDTNFSGYITSDDLTAMVEARDAAKQQLKTQLDNSISQMSILQLRNKIATIREFVENNDANAVVPEALLGLDSDFNRQLTLADIAPFEAELNKKSQARRNKFAENRADMSIDSLMDVIEGVNTLLANANAQSVAVTSQNENLDTNVDGVINAADAQPYTAKRNADLEAANQARLSEMAGMSIDELTERSAEILAEVSAKGAQATTDDNRHFDINNDGTIDNKDAQDYATKATQDSEAAHQARQNELAGMSIDELNERADAILAYVNNNGDQAVNDSNRNFDINNDGTVNGDDAAIYADKASDDTDAANQQRQDSLANMSASQLRKAKGDVDTHLANNGDTDVTDATRAMDYTSDNRITADDAQTVQTRFEAVRNGEMDAKEYFELFADADEVQVYIDNNGTGTAVTDNNWLLDTTFNGTIDNDDVTKLRGKGNAKANGVRRAHDTRLSAATEAEILAEEKAIADTIANGDVKVTGQNKHKDLDANGILDTADLQRARDARREKRETYLNTLVYFQSGNEAQRVTDYINANGSGNEVTAATVDLDFNADGIIDAADAQIPNTDAATKATAHAEAQQARLVADTEAGNLSEENAIEAAIADGPVVVDMADKAAMDINGDGTIDSGDLDAVRDARGKKRNESLTDKEYFESADEANQVTNYINDNGTGNAVTEATLDLDYNADGIITAADAQIPDTDATTKATEAREANQTRLDAAELSELETERDTLTTFINDNGDTDTDRTNKMFDLNADGKIDAADITFIQDEIDSRA